MSFRNKYLKPHLIFGGKTFEKYCSQIPKFYFRPGVPEDVIKNFEVVERLLAHSFYEYKFIDEALAKAIHSFEMAMSIRYKDFYADNKKHTFNELITKLTEKNLFETNIETLKHVKFLRNYFSHPERHSFAGVVYWNRIEFINRLVNEMYEDVPLRLERIKLYENFFLQQQSKNLCKGVVIEIQDKPYILYNLHLLFINNKKKPNSYLFACTPIFDLETNGNSIKTPYVFKAKIFNLSFKKNVLIGTSFTAKEKIKFSPIEDRKDLLPEFEIWNSTYQTMKNKFQFESAMSFHIPELIIPELREFEKA